MSPKRWLKVGLVMSIAVVAGSLYCLTLSDAATVLLAKGMLFFGVLLSVFYGFAIWKSRQY